MGMRKTKGRGSMKPEEKDKLIKFYKGFCLKYSLDWQKVLDIEAEIDASLSYSEQKNILIDKLKLLLKPEDKLSRAEARAIQDHEQHQKRQQAEALLQAIETRESMPLLDTHSTLRHYISMLNKRLLSSLICHSRAGLGKCIHLNKTSDFVLSGDGKMIKLDKIPDKLMVLDTDTLKLCNTPAVKTYNREVNELLRITTRTGKQIELTKEHPLLSINGWKEAKDFAKGEHLATPRKYDELGTKKTLSESYVKIMAYLLAEGCLTGRNITFANTDKDIISDMITSIETEYPSLTLKKLKHGVDFIISSKNKKIKTELSSGACVDCGTETFSTKYMGGLRCRSCYQKLHQNPLHDELKKQGLVYHNSENKFIPQNILSQPNESIALFLNRFFSCDGWAYGAEIAICLKSETMIRQIQHLLLRFGIISIIKKQLKYATNTTNKTKRPYWKLYITDGLCKRAFRDKIGFLLKRKQDAIVISEHYNPNIDIIPLKTSRARYQTRKTCKIKKLAESDIFWDEISSIETVNGNFKVWDVEVSHDSHNFIYNDVIVHNSYTVLNYLRQLKAKFAYYSGYTTPLSLYSTLYEHRENLIILDDIEGIFSDKKAIAILKACLWNGEEARIVSYNTTSDKADDLPASFEFTGSIIVLCNELVGRKGEHFKALLSRSLTYELKMSHAEVKHIAEQIINNDTELSEEQKNRVKEIINTEVSAVSEFNLRELRKLMQIVKYSTEESAGLFRETFRQDEDMLLIEQLNSMGLTAIEQCAEFTLMTGKSRRTFFNYRKKYKELTKSAKVQQKTDAAPAPIRDKRE